MSAAFSATGFDRLRAWSYLPIILVSILVWRLFDRSVLAHSVAIEAAKDQQRIRSEIPPRRGRILVKNKQELTPIATTRELYQILVIPRNIRHPDQIAKILSEKLGLDEHELFNSINNKKLYLPPIKRRVEKAVAESIGELNLTGVLLVPEHIRFYPDNGLGAQVIGFVNNDGEGNYGLEGYYHQELIGFPGTVIAEKDNLGRYINVDKMLPAKNGSDLVLSIDQNVQFTAEKMIKEAVEKFAAQSGQLIISEVKTGSVIALATDKSYDPNKFNEIRPEEQSIFLNPVIANVYEPGSIMKPIIIASGLDAQKIKPEDEIQSSNVVVVQGYEIHTAQDKNFGRQNITQVLENSDNVAMVEIANRISNDTLRKYLADFNFGLPLNVDLDGETTGRLPPIKEWRDINRATIAFGQGISATPLQILAAYQAIGNGGMLMRPKLVERMIRQDGSEVRLEPKSIRQVIAPEAAAQVRQMLISVVENGHGKKAKVKGYKIGGKTGTAQIPKTDGGGYEEDAHIGSFVGLVPAEEPRFVMLVKLDRPQNVEFAESSAAPTFSKMAEWLVNYYQIPPTE